MDHNEAVRLEAAEKYVLGELPPTFREEYEEHYFDCPECALDVKAAAAFVDSSREVWRQDRENSLEREAVPALGGWFRWLQPRVAMPVFAALLIIIGYQNTVTIPRARQEATRGAAQLFTSSFSLQIANTRGGEEIKLQVHPNESFALNFDFTPAKTFDSYICQLRDGTGHTLLQVSLPGSSANKEAHLLVPAGLVRPGKYNLVFYGVSGSNGQISKDEVLRLAFSVEIL